ncbi:MAG: hypothetical protein R3F19_11770 [Verrucomicrobiales bacterium]
MRKENKREDRWEAGLKRILWAYWITATALVAPLLLSLYLAQRENQASAKNRNVRFVALSLRNALESYRRKYRTWSWLSPTPTIASDFVISSDSELITTLLGSNEGLRNPSKVAFGKWSDADETGKNGIIYRSDGEIGGLVDLWGHPFQIHLDGDGDGCLADPRNPKNRIRRISLVYSAGPDGDFATWDDNVETL